MVYVQLRRDDTINKNGILVPILHIIIYHLALLKFNVATTLEFYLENKEQENTLNNRYSSSCLKFAHTQPA